MQPNKFLYYITFMFLAFYNTANAQTNSREQKVEKPPTYLSNKEGDNKITILNIYYNPKTDFVSTTPNSNLQKKTVPLVINFPGKDFCYTSCITDDQSKAIFSHKDYGNIVGMMKVKGYYDSNFFCNIYGVDYTDYRMDSNLSNICFTFFQNNCPNSSSCYMNGNTGKLFIQY